jgi:glutamine synthetase
MQDTMGVNIITEKNVNKVLFKIPGADTNFYLSLYALLSSVKQGVQSQSKLQTVLQEVKEKSLPINLNSANRHFLKNDFMKDMLTEPIHQHYNAFYNFEYSEYMNQVDDWELHRYLLNI